MSDIDTGKIMTVWDEEEQQRLYQAGWRHVAYPPAYWLMVPPKPTLAERLDGVIDAADPHDIDCVPIFDAKAELRRLTKIEAAARYAVDHQSECGVVERLRNALEQ